MAKSTYYIDSYFRFPAKNQVISKFISKLWYKVQHQPASLFVYLLVCLAFFKKWANPSLFFIYFRLLKHITNFTTNTYVKKCPSSIQCQDSNSQPLEHEPPPITTIPGLPPLQTCPTTDQLWVLVLFGQLWSWSFVVKWGSNQASQILLYNDCELQAFNANALDRLFKYSINFVV